MIGTTVVRALEHAAAMFDAIAIMRPRARLLD
jgi:hypothetical protein